MPNEDQQYPYIEPGEFTDSANQTADTPPGESLVVEPIDSQSRILAIGKIILPNTLSREIQRPRRRIIPGFDDPAIDSSVVSNHAGIEMDEVGAIPSMESTVSFVENTLRKEPAYRDAADLLRPAYHIAGRRVIFKNRMERIQLDDADITIVGADSVKPVQFIKLHQMELEQYQETYDEEKKAIVSVLAQEELRDEQTIHELDIYNMNHSQDNPGNTLVVTNTPLGLVEAAILLGASTLETTKAAMLEKNYNDPNCQELVDRLVAALTISDTGQPFQRYYTDGYAVALASLVGDPTAEAILAYKKKFLLESEVTRIEEIAQYKRSEEKWYEERDIEPMPIDKLCLVHTTSHAIQGNDRGEVILKSTGQYIDEVPRASVHFTLNSMVAAHAQAQDGWGVDQRVLIAPLAATMNANGQKPEVLDGVDTWFMLNPGQSLVLPNAWVIEPVRTADSLYSQTGTSIQVLIKDTYSSAEIEQIEELAQRTGVHGWGKYQQFDNPANLLKEAIVQRVLSSFGVEYTERDAPSPHGHGMANQALALRILAAGTRMGIRSGHHFEQPEATYEQESVGILRSAFAMKKSIKGLDQSDSFSDDATMVGMAPLAAIRQAIVNGCTKAVPVTLAYQNDDWSNFI